MYLDVFSIMSNMESSVVSHKQPAATGVIADGMGSKELQSEQSYFSHMWQIKGMEFPLEVVNLGDPETHTQFIRLDM